MACSSTTARPPTATRRSSRLPTRAPTPSAILSNPGGISSYSLAFVSQLIGGVLQFTTLVSPPNQTPSVYTGSAGATGANIAVNSGQGTAAGHPANLTLADSLLGTGGAAQAIFGTGGGTLAAATSALLEIQGSLALKGNATPAAPAAGNALLFADTTGFLRMLAGLAGDTTVYGAARRSFALVSAQTISSTSQVVVGSSGAGNVQWQTNVGIGTYRFAGEIVIVEGGTTGHERLAGRRVGDVRGRVGAAVRPGADPGARHGLDGCRHRCHARVGPGQYGHDERLVAVVADQGHGRGDRGGDDELRGADHHSSH